MSLFDFFKFKIRKRRIIECKTDDSIIVIPRKVIGINPYSFSYTKASQVIIPPNVKKISDYSFANNRNILKVEMSDNMIELGNCIFVNNANLEEVKLSSQIDILPMGIFSGCRDLKKINIPSNLTVIGDNAFYMCRSLSEFDYQYPLIEIKRKAFSKSGLENVDLSKSRVLNIEDAAFSSCLKLKRAKMSEKLKYIGKDAFSECKSLTDISLNEGLLTIDDQAFKATRIKNIVIPNTVEHIGARAFFFSTSLESIVMPNNLKRIEEQCFGYCDSLKNVKFPNKLQYIDRDAFAGCYSLEEVDLPSSLKVLSVNAFSNCRSLKKVIINGNNTIVTKKTFSSCYNLEKIIYKGVEINVKNIEVDIIDNEVLDYLLKHHEQLKKIETRLDIEMIKRLDRDGQLEDFVNNGYYKNYRHLYSKLFSNNKGNMDNKNAFFMLAYKLGVFDRETSQKSSVILEALIDNKVLSSQKIASQIGELTLTKLNIESLKEITTNNGSFIHDIMLYSKKNEGFIGKCLENYEQVQFTNTTNRGSHRRLKPTLIKFVNYFKKDKFIGVETYEDEILAIEIGKFFDEQEIYEKAKLVMERFKKENVVESLISEKYRKEKFNEIEASKKKFLQQQEKGKNILNNLYYEFLKKNDVLNLTIGKYCDLCCAHIDGMGENLCFASILDENTQTLVIRNCFNEILAKATFTIIKEKNSLIINTIQTNTHLSKGREKEISLKLQESIKKFINIYNKEHKEKINYAYTGTKSSMLLDQFQDRPFGYCPSIDYNKYSMGTNYEGDWKEKQICLYDSKIISK